MRLKHFIYKCYAYKHFKNSMDPIKANFVIEVRKVGIQSHTQFSLTALESLETEKGNVSSGIQLSQTYK